MGPAVLDDVWKFGSDDETLFKLIRGEISQQTMPAVFGKVLKDEEIWKMIAYIRSLYRGDPSKITWGPVPGGGTEPAAAPPVAAAEMGDALSKGRAAYATYCASCHGQGGKGDGPAAAALSPKPRDLTDRAHMAQLDDQYLFQVIGKGGAAVGKSPLMPPAALGEQDIRNVIAYLRTLAGSGSP
jgi:mono/diheme cytochrome c family protein